MKREGSTRTSVSSMSRYLPVNMAIRLDRDIERFSRSSSTSLNVPPVQIEQRGQDLGTHGIEVVAEHRAHGQQGPQPAPSLGREQRFDSEYLPQLQRARHDPVERRVASALPVMVVLRPVQDEVVIPVDVVPDSRDDPLEIGGDDAGALQQRLEEGETPER